MNFRYLGKRLLIMVPTFFGITILAYVLSSLAPGDPIYMIVGNTNELTEENLQLLRAQYGLDKPVVVQYFYWLGRLLQGNFGTSYRTSQPVFEMITARLGPTLMLTITAMVIAVCLAVPLGVIAAIRPNAFLDQLIQALSFLATSAPNFFISLILVYFLSVKLDIFPVSGMYTSASDKSLPDLLIHMVLPVTVLVVAQLGNLIRQTRGSMLEVMQEDYIRTARAKGLKERRIILRHGLRNALIPVVTTIGMSLPMIVGGAVVTEQIFGWPGLGTLMMTSITARDYPCIMGITVMISVIVLLGNLITDLIYGILDPRISYK